MSKAQISMIALAAAIAATGGLSLIQAQRLAAFAQPRNVLFILIDTLRADHLSCYGYPRQTSPVLDKLAGQGVRFDNAIAQRPKTSPSVASIFTGTYPYTHGLDACRQWLPDECVTLAEVFTQAGWQTASIYANQNVGPEFNFDQGFERTQAVGRADDATDAACQWLVRHADRPFFLYVHYLDPHAPYEPPSPYRDRFVGDESYGQFAHLQPGVGESGYIGQINKSVLIESSTDVDLYVARYDEEILYTDAAVGRLLETLKQLDLEDNTLVIVTSDHGEGLGDHNYYFAHGQFAYDHQVRVPLIVRYPPAVTRGRVVEEVVELVDIMPTLLDMAGLPGTGAIEGRSLAPVLLGAEHRGPGVAFCEVGSRYEPTGALRTRDYKLIRRAVDRTLEFYDLRTDPGERKNLVGARPAKVRLLNSRLERWLAEAPGDRDPRTVPLQHISRDVEQQLRDLGYVQ